jgi:DNA invertase Pin-like site-specific DNA recombinase
MLTSRRHLLLDGYIRVSDVRRRSGPSFISPVVQRQRLQQWCELYRARLVEVYEELDLSGRGVHRPMLEQAIERVEHGVTDGIIVPYLSRFGRSFADAARQLARIQQAHGTFISVDEQFDLDTDIGRLMLRHMMAFNEYEADRIKSSWNDARRLATARGVHGGSYAPVGYRRRADGRLEIDLQTAVHVRHIFDMRVRGASLADVGRYLREHHVKSGLGTMVWNPTSVQRLFESRTYLGEIHNGPYSCLDAHPPLVDPVTWQLARHLPAVHTEPPRPGLLYGILRCASCRSHLTLWSGGRLAADRMYRCGRVPSQRGPCPRRAWVTASTMDALAEDLLFAAARRRPQIARKTQAAILRAQRAVAEADRRLARYRDDDRMQHVLTESQFLAGLQVRSDAAEQTAADLRHLQAASTGVEALKLRGIEHRWDDMSLAERRTALGWVFQAIFLSPERGPVEDRIWICEHGEAPARMPVRFRPQPPRTFRFPTSEKQVSRQRRRILAARRCGWNDAEIEARLRDFVADRDVFPTPQQFLANGQRRLYDHVALRGGGPVWAARLGVAFDQGRRTKTLRWTADRVRNELAEFLADKETWPTISEFRACGKAALRRAVIRFGGQDYWAQQFGLHLANRRGPHLAWPDERIQRELKTLIGDRTEWPRRREFDANGLNGCYAALWRGAGVHSWAHRMGVSPPPACRGGRRPRPRPPAAGGHEAP